MHASNFDSKNTRWILANPAMAKSCLGRKEYSGQKKKVILCPFDLFRCYVGGNFNRIEFTQQMYSKIFRVPKLSPSSSLVDYGSILSELLEDSSNCLPWHIQILYGKKLAIVRKVKPNKQYFGSCTIQNALPSFSWPRYCIFSITWILSKEISSASWNRKCKCKCHDKLTCIVNHKGKKHCSRSPSTRLANDDSLSFWLFFGM